MENLEEKKYYILTNHNNEKYTIFLESFEYRNEKNVVKDYEGIYPPHKYWVLEFKIKEDIKEDINGDKNPLNLIDDCKLFFSGIAYFVDETYTYTIQIFNDSKYYNNFKISNHIKMINYKK